MIILNIISKGKHRKKLALMNHKLMKIARIVKKKRKKIRMIRKMGRMKMKIIK
jgi:hypothetical protein